MESSRGSSSSQTLGWIAAVVLIPMFLLVILVFGFAWGQWIFRRGRERYWARVQHEHMLATGGGVTVTPSASPVVFSNQFTDIDGIYDEFEFEV